MRLPRDMSGEDLAGQLRLLWVSTRPAARRPHDADQNQWRRVGDAGPAHLGGIVGVGGVMVVSPGFSRKTGGSPPEDGRVGDAAAGRGVSGEQ